MCFARGLSLAAGTIVFVEESKHCIKQACKIEVAYCHVEVIFEVKIDGTCACVVAVGILFCNKTHSKDCSLVLFSKRCHAVNCCDVLVVEFNCEVCMRQDIVEVKQGLGNVERIVFNFAWVNFDKVVANLDIDFVNAFKLCSAADCFERDAVRQVLFDILLALIACSLLAFQQLVFVLDEFIDFCICRIVIAKFCIDDICRKVDWNFRIESQLDCDTETKLSCNIGWDVVLEQQISNERGQCILFIDCFILWDFGENCASICIAHLDEDV